MVIRHNLLPSCFVVRTTNS